MDPQRLAFIKLIRNPVRFRLFQFSKLPSAYFSGLRVGALDENGAAVTVPYKWFTKNPFRSTYFACLAMAAEMSTGLLAMLHIYNRKPGISMLVVKMEAHYYKKAVGVTRFTCADGQAIGEAVENAVRTGEGQQITAKSIGVNMAEEEIAAFFVTWSFKVKKKG